MSLSMPHKTWALPAFLDSSSSVALTWWATALRRLFRRQRLSLVMSEAADKPFGAHYVHVELSGKSQHGTCPAVCRRFVETSATEQKYRQWHCHHHSPALPPPPVSQNVIGSARITKAVLGSPGEQLLHLLHTSYATGGTIKSSLTNIQWTMDLWTI